MDAPHNDNSFSLKTLSAEFLKRKRLLLLPPLVLGLLAIAVMKACSRGPQRKAPAEVARKVRIIEAPATAVVPRAIGYGSAQPGRVWQAVAQVSGRIVEVHPRFEEGELLKADSVILRIDPTKYEFAVSQYESNIRNARAQLNQLDVGAENLRALLDIEMRTLALSHKELERKRQLLSQDAIPASEADREESRFLAQQNKVRQLRNEINLIPAKRESLNAQLALAEAQLADARYNLENTIVRLPFYARLARAHVEIAQFVNAGAVMAEADSVDVTEVVAHIPLSMMKNLIDPAAAQPLAIGPDLDLSEAIESFGLTAKVRIDDGTLQAEWDARVARILEHIDPATRTLGVVVAVDDPYLKAIPGLRPPLVKGMFCEVELRAKARPERVIIPRSALQGDAVFVADSESRLRKRAVAAAFPQSGFVVLSSGISPGEHVVVSDPVPAIEGMLLKLENDTALQQKIIAEATGSGQVK